MDAMLLIPLSWSILTLLYAEWTWCGAIRMNTPQTCTDDLCPMFDDCRLAQVGPPPENPRPPGAMRCSEYRYMPRVERDEADDGETPNLPGV